MTIVKEKRKRRKRKRKRKKRMINLVMIPTWSNLIRKMITCQILLKSLSLMDLK